LLPFFSGSNAFCVWRIEKLKNCNPESIPFSQLFVMVFIQKHMPKRIRAPYFNGELKLTAIEWIHSNSLYCLKEQFV
jgi:hypothetical protein